MDYEVFDLGDVNLQSGVTLPNAFLAYKTYGVLNEKKDNVIVYPTAFGDQHVQNEWLIGNGMALDPQKYFIIIPNLLGNGLSSSPSNTAPPFDRGHFPQVTIYDNVNFQHRLVTEKFGIEKIALVVGWSMGGIQSFQWAASYPDMVERIAPFCGAARTWPQAYVVLDGMKAALMAAIDFDSSKVNQLTSAHMRSVGRVYAGWGLSQTYYREGLYRDMGFDALEDFVAGVWDDSFMKMDPHNVLAMLWTGQNADISANPVYKGDFDKALQNIKAQACIMPGSTDLFCTSDENEYEAKLIPNAVLHPIESIWGHFAGRGINSADSKFIDDNLRHLLSLHPNRLRTARN
ncbi:alpha/beta hydrolase fold protein [Paenibacillus sp. TCA20]|uniref:alpha/beta fold hydrolase n=1 Tax=Paenibacillus sp. TCA20 TaxID=1499968 RepID=UPI0004DAA55D|nr:alpha/beta fold hydrolase [Paenibacillus sp. TCA20]GAK42794.1 alpha/beta hydrolase fold protein [Paenibacillus sp. TCA20]